MDWQSASGVYSRLQSHPTFPFFLISLTCLQTQLCRTLGVGSVFELKALLKELPLWGRKAKGSADIPVNGDSTKRIL